MRELANIYLVLENNSESFDILTSLFYVFENICLKQKIIACMNEILAISINYFKMIIEKPEIMGRIFPDCPILSMFAISHSISTSYSEKMKNYAFILFKFEKVSPIYRYARARLLASLLPHLSLLSTEEKNSMSDVGSLIIEQFLSEPNSHIAGLIPSLVTCFVPKPESRGQWFARFVEISMKDPSISAYMIPSAVSVSDRREDESKKLLDALTPSLSVIPFHFATTLPDDSVVNAFNVSVRALQDFITESTADQITQFLVQSSKVSKLEQRLGIQYSLTCLYKMGVPLSVDAISSVFDCITSPLESGTLAELALAILSSKKHILPWPDMEAFLEHCFSYSNEMTSQFVLDAATMLGKLIDDSPSVVLQVITSRVNLKFDCASVHFSILNSYCEKSKLQIDAFPPHLTVNLCLFLYSKPKSGLNEYFRMSSLLSNPKTIFDFLGNLDANLHSEPTRSLMARYSNIDSYKSLLCKFLIKLTSKCSKSEAARNASVCIEMLQNNIEKNLDDITSFLANYLLVDYQAAIQIVLSLIQTQNRGWFIFSSTNKNYITIHVVFDTLLKLQDNITTYILFAAEYLPETSDEQLCQDVVCILANVLRRISPIDKGFPPKCRLFDFISAVHYISNNDIYRCIGELLTIPPICQVEHIPLVTELTVKSKEISKDLLFMIKSALEIVETSNDLQLLITPFLTITNLNQQYSILLSILDSLVGEVNNTNNDYPSLGYNASHIIEPNGSPIDGYLSLIARIIGYLIPVYEVSHEAVHLTLRLLWKLTQKSGNRQQMSLQDVVRSIASSFNSQCLLITANLLCENLSITSATAFLILFNERESELLHCVQLFVSNLLQEHESKASMVFDSNETLAKAAISLLDVKQFSIIKSALLSSQFRDQLIGILMESVHQKPQVLANIFLDDDLRKFLEPNSAEIQYSLIVTNPQYLSSIQDWTNNQISAFLSLVESKILSFPHNMVLRFALNLSQFKDDKVIPKIISIFNPFFRNETGKEILSVFVSSHHFLPFLIPYFGDNSALSMDILPIALKNSLALTSLQSILPYYLFEIIESGYLDLIELQTDKSILLPLLPILCSTVMHKTPKLQQKIINLIGIVCGVTFSKIPSSYVALIEFLSEIRFQPFTPDLFIVCFNRCQKEMHLPTIVVLSFLSQQGLIEPDNIQQLVQMIKLHINDSDEDTCAAILISASCFPINIFK